MSPRKNLIVAELEWCIASDPLLQSVHSNDGFLTLDRHWCMERLDYSQQWLNDLDRDPSALLAFCGTDQLLGKRFESLLAFWFMQSPIFEVIASNDQLIVEKHTLGEIDFVVKDHLSNRLLHIEVACKFYLGHQNKAGWSDWKGVNAKDNLQLKMDKFQKQLSVLSTPAGLSYLQNRGLKQVQSAMLLKGYFFHHIHCIADHKSPKNASSGYASGFWLYQQETFSFFSSDNRWMVLPKRSWLCRFFGSVDSCDILNDVDIHQIVKEFIQLKSRGLMIIQISENDGWVTELNRGFVVPNSWPF